MSKQQPLGIVLKQIDSAKPELEAYPPLGFGWHRRCVVTAKILIPFLTSLAPQLKTFVEEVLNSKQLVRDSWKKIKSATGKTIPPQLRNLMDRELEREAILLDTVGGDVISKVIEKFLIEGFPNAHLESNGRSDYPDLFLRSKDYDGLPKFEKLKDSTKHYGAAIKGATNRAVRVPDGLEIKTCKDRFAVDCHHAHAGLHLALIFSGRKGSIEVSEVMVAFMRHADYRITKTASPTTTLKASFNGKTFVSLIPRDTSAS